MGKKTSVDYDVTPDDLTGLRNTAAKSVKGCCECVYLKDGIHGKSGKIRQLRADGKSYNGQTDTTWKAEIIIDSQTADKQIIVSTRMLMKNATGDTSSYPDTVAINDDELKSRVAKISPAINAAWNARPYKLKITDRKCGEREFTVKFNAQIIAGGTPHYTVNFVNVPGMGVRMDQVVKTVTSGRSYVLPPSYRAKFNVGDHRSATDKIPPGILEAHEYGHMLGLKDEYHDIPADRGGVEYEFHNGTKERVGVNTELMGNMGTQTAQPERYCLTVAYAVVAILAQNGCPVSKMEIL